MKPSISASTRSVRSMKPSRAARQSAPLARAALVEPAPRRARRPRPAAARAASGNTRLSKCAPSSSNCARRSASTRQDTGSGNAALGIAVRRLALRLDEDRPAGAEAAQRVVEPRGDRDQFGRRRGIEIRSAKPRRALERAVLVEDDALSDQRRPRAGSRRGSASGWRYSARFIMASASRDQMLRVAQVPAHHIDERRDRAWRPTPPRHGRSARSRRRRSRGAGQARSRRRACR